DLSGQLSVLADRGLTPDMGPAVYAIAGWVMNRGQEFVSADLTRDSRVADPAVGAVMSFSLSCRGRRVGALVALDHQASEREPRSGRPLSLLFIDLDGFKGVNDTHGHLCGSRALVEAAAVIRSSARETDVVARFGGDEFALVLPDTGGEGAYAVGERIRDRNAAHRFLAGDGLVP